MATIAERILAAVANQGPCNDDDLAARLGVARQAINQAARRLVDRGQLARDIGPGGKIINRLPHKPAPEPPQPRANAGNLLSEDEVKEAVRAHLAADGWTVDVAWGRQRGIDIDARRDTERLIIEAKGEVALQPQQVNYFLGALGELLQRMDDPTARYGVALPDNRQYRGLVERLPALAKERLELVVYFVSRNHNGLRIEVT
jgi:hypothetical protein